MKKNLSILGCIAAVGALLILSGCFGDEGGGGEPPASKADKIVFSASGSSVAKLSPVKQNGIFATSLVEGGAAQMSPSGADYSTAVGLAPNGDVWTINKYGLFVSNMNQSAPKPRMILSSQQMAKDFISNPEDGVYRASAPYSAVFAKDPSDQNAYFALFGYEISFLPAGMQDNGPVVKYYWSTIKYSSKDNSFSKFLLDPVDVSKMPTDASYVLFPSPCRGLSAGLCYMVSKYTSGNYTSGNFGKTSLDSYDPSSGKHTMLLSVDVKATISDGCTINSGKCRFATAELSISSDACQRTYDDNAAIAQKKKEVADCVNGELDKKFVYVKDYPVGSTDITDKVATLSGIQKLFDETAPNATDVFSIKLSKIEIAKPDYANCGGGKCWYPPMEAWLSIDHFVLGKDGAYFLGNPTDPALANKTLYRVSNDGTESVVAPQATTGSLDILRGVGGLGDVVLYDVPASTGPVAYSSALNKSVTLPASADSNYFAIKAEDTRSKARGVTADGKYYLYTKASSSADGKSVSKAYYTSLGKLFGGETPEEIEAAPGTEGLTPLFNWKGYMLWLGKNGVYLNRPFEQDKAMIMVKDGLTSATDIKAGTVTAFVPDEGLGFDISADLGGMFNCGVGGKLATYCASSHDMCEGDKCVAKIIGPVCTPICTGKACGDDGCGGSCGTCDNGKGCTDGQCTGCACGNKACGPDGCGGSCGTCPVGYKCTIEQICGCLPSCVGKACGDDGCGGICGKCAPSLSCQDGKCVEGQPPSACTDTSCADGSVCFDGKECLKKANGTIETKVSHTTITPDSVIYEVTVTFTPSEDKNEYAISADDIYFKDGTTRQSYVKLVVAGTVKIQIKEPGSLAEQHAKVYVWPLYDASKGKVEWSKDNLSIDTTVLLSNPGHCNLIKQGAMKCPTGYSCKNHVCKAN